MKKNIEDYVVGIDKTYRISQSTPSKKFIGDLERQLDRKICIVSFEEFEDLCKYYGFNSINLLEADRIENTEYKKISDSIKRFEYRSLLYIKFTNGWDLLDDSIIDKYMEDYKEYNELRETLLKDPHEGQNNLERLYIIADKGYKPEFIVRNCAYNEHGLVRYSLLEAKEELSLSNSIRDIVATGDPTIYVPFDFEVRSFSFNSDTNYFFVDKFIDTTKLTIGKDIKMDKGIFLSYTPRFISEVMIEPEKEDFILVGDLVCQSCPFGIIIYNNFKQIEPVKNGIQRIYQLYSY